MLRIPKEPKILESIGPGSAHQRKRQEKMSYYRTVTVYHLPERRSEGVAKLRELCQLLNNRDAVTEILTNFAGDSFRIHVVSRFATLAQFEALNAWAATDAGYQLWLQSVQDLFDWQRTETQLYKVVH